MLSGNQSLDEQGDELHAIIPKNIIWKFDKQIREGGLYTIEKITLGCC